MQLRPHAVCLNTARGVEWMEVFHIMDPEDQDFYSHLRDHHNCWRAHMRESMLNSPEKWEMVLKDSPFSPKAKGKASWPFKGDQNFYASAEALAGDPQKAK